MTLEARPLYLGGPYAPAPYIYHKMLLTDGSRITRRSRETHTQVLTKNESLQYVVVFCSVPCRVGESFHEHFSRNTIQPKMICSPSGAVPLLNSGSRGMHIHRKILGKSEKGFGKRSPPEQRRLGNQCETLPVVCIDVGPKHCPVYWMYRSSRQRPSNKRDGSHRRIKASTASVTASISVPSVLPTKPAILSKRQRLMLRLHT